MRLNERNDCFAFHLKKRSISISRISFANCLSLTGTDWTRISISLTSIVAVVTWMTSMLSVYLEWALHLVIPAFSFRLPIRVCWKFLIPYWFHTSLFWVRFHIFGVDDWAVFAILAVPKSIAILLTELSEIKSILYAIWILFYPSRKSKRFQRFWTYPPLLTSVLLGVLFPTVFYAFYYYPVMPIAKMAP